MQPYGMQSKNSMKITVVIPTKNRPCDLIAAVKSIINQSRKPDQLVIVDQSSNMISRNAVTTEMNYVLGIDLTYIYDPTIQGLVAAKAESLKFASGEIICFLEDDVVLEQEYIGAIENGFSQKDTMLGCSGVVTNPPKAGKLYLFFYNMFHRGIFEDGRPTVYANINSGSKALIESKELSGGLSAWRKEVFDHVGFDVKNGFHMLEDFEFSRRATVYFGRRFFINPKARLAHNFSPINRDILDIKQNRKVTEYILYYKKNSSSPYSLTAMVWLLLGLFIDAFAQSMRCRTLLPLLGTITGLVNGMRKAIV